MISKRARSPAYVVAADFLRARLWVGNCIAAASRGVMPSAGYPADLDEEIIEELLTYERCAAWLLDGLTAGGFVKSLPQSTVEIIRRAAMRETQSTMRALFDARELSSLAARLGIPIIVLKGGVRAITAASPALPLVDIDILVPADKVTAVVAELVSAGFGEARPPLAHHQGTEPANDHLSVEVHWSLLGDGLPVEPGVWDRKEPIVNAQGLFSLGRTDNLVHVARHALENHRQRPVSLRDTLLAGAIANTCSAEVWSSLAMNCKCETTRRKRCKSFRLDCMHEPTSEAIDCNARAPCTRPRTRAVGALLLVSRVRWNGERWHLSKQFVAEQSGRCLHHRPRRHSDRCPHRLDVEGV